MAFPRELTQEDKEALIQKVLRDYEANPERLRQALPEVAELLDSLEGIIPATPQSGLQDFDASQLTEGERDFHEEALRDILRRVRSISTEEAVKGLEHGAVLLDNRAAGFARGFPNREELLKLVSKATSIRPRKTGEPVEKVVREGEASRTVSVVRGLLLHLTWEFKLVKVTMDPHQWKLQCQALSVVGIGRDRDGATDVSARHDDYFVDAILDG